MLDQCIIFTKSGLVLWETTLAKLRGNPVEKLIHSVLMGDRVGDKQFTVDTYTLKWCLDNKLDFVILIVHQKILTLTYVDELLEKVKKTFAEAFRDEIVQCRPVDFSFEFDKILREVEKNALLKRSKAAPVKETKPESRGEEKVQDREEDRESEAEDNKVEDEKHDAVNEFEDLKLSSKGPRKVMRTGGKKPKKSKETSSEGGDDKKIKKMTKWSDSKISHDEMKALDRSKENGVANEDAQIKDLRKAYIGEGVGVVENDDDEEWTDDEEDESSEASSFISASKSSSSSSSVAHPPDYESDVSTSSESASKWSFSQSRIGSFFQTLSGNKTLEREDLVPIMNDLKSQLIAKNVASEVAAELSESVITSLVGHRLETFTRITTVVKKSLESALLRILTPKKSTDILRDILAVNASGKTYSIVFVGVNGVGKSTSLSKVAYYLKSKGVNIMLAACDTFRSGAVEQLNQHAKVLGVPLFERGYAKDPASVAKDAVKYASEHGYDCVLIDTAGRMQNNEPLMRALAKLVSTNDPNLVLFVGEALVGNDGIDQLSLFDRALEDFSDRQNPHKIDGIVLTKFDTIDDKVGAAVSMVYKTGQPIMFVGTGQKYTHLKKLNVKTVLKNLLE